MKMQHHYDKLGQELIPDDYVAFPQANGLMIGKIIRLSNKMLIIDAIISKKIRFGYRKYPADVVKLNLDAALTMFLIKNT